MQYTSIPRKFYNRNSVAIAKELLGKLLIRRLDRAVLIGKIVETEAYLGTKDEAAHSFKGKTERNKVLFGKSGLAYVHNMHRYSLLDITAGKIDVPESVLIRALEPIKGISLMQQNRSKEKLTDLCSGPGKLCQAFGITLKDYGIDLTTSKSHIIISGSEKIKKEEIIKTTRIGITKAADLHLRFYIKNNEFISKK